MNVRKNIIDSTIRLIQKHNFKNISVNMIIKEAEVSRSTFYRYFIDKYDVINHFYKDFCDNLHNENLTQKEELIRIFIFLNENRSVFINTMDIHDQNCLWSFILDYHFKKNYSVNLDDTKLVELHFFLGGFFHVCQKWLQKYDDIKPEQIADIVDHIETLFLYREHEQ